MQSHPNYKGYDATKGKPRDRPVKVSVELSALMGKVTADDLYLAVPKSWMKPINAVAEWCQLRGLDFYPSPHAYQIAKIGGAGFTIVLWASKEKKTKRPYIKAAFEGPGYAPGSHDALKSITEMVKV